MTFALLTAGGAGALLVLLGLATGCLGALVGIGGGVIIVPILSLGFGVPMSSAVATSLVCVIASSSGAASAYLRDHLVDLRLGMQLELFTVAGAVAGAFFAPLLPAAFLQVLFGAMSLPVVHGLLWRPAPELPGPGTVRHLPFGYAASFGAGALSGTLGIGGGPIKVPVMTLVMGVPLKVAAATSNLMIGVTAAASVFIYWSRGLLDLGLAAPIVLGALVGSALGARLLPRVSSRVLRWMLALVLLYLGVQMIVRGLA